MSDPVPVANATPDTSGIELGGPDLAASRFDRLFSEPARVDPRLLHLLDEQTDDTQGRC